MQKKYSKLNLYTELKWLTLLLQFDVNHTIILALPTVSDWVNHPWRSSAKFIPDQRYAFGNARPLLFNVFCKTVDNVSSTFGKNKVIFLFQKTSKSLMDENRTNLVAFVSVSGWKCIILICMQTLQFKERLRKLNEGRREHESFSKIWHTKEDKAAGTNNVCWSSMCGVCKCALGCCFYAVLLLLSVHSMCSKAGNLTWSLND